MQKQYTLTEKDIEQIIEVSFKNGQRWAETYTSWFQPTDKDNNEHLQEAKDEIFNVLENFS